MRIASFHGRCGLGARVTCKRAQVEADLTALEQEQQAGAGVEAQIEAFVGIVATRALNCGDPKPFGT